LSLVVVRLPHDAKICLTTEYMISFFKCFLPLVAFTVLYSDAEANRIEIIPEPVQIVERNGNFMLSNATIVYAEAEDSITKSTINYFIQGVFDQTGMRLTTKVGATSKPDRAILIQMLRPLGKFSSNESYELDIGGSSVKITTSGEAGLFYAFQSLLQLLPSNLGSNQKEILIPCADIYDYPRFGYRGMHLDVSRHFFSASFIKHYLDILSRYKINHFHWHFTDSHGWRMEIKKYPRLTSVGAWRAERQNTPMTIALPTQIGEAAGYGGFYTQEEIEDIIRYAKERFITIIPEIEMPGHCTAAVVAYPEYTCLNNPVPLLMPTGYAGDLLHNFCAGYDSTYIFLNDILKEVMDIFPSEYIHIGGDEVRGASWLNCPRCKKRMEEKGYTTARELQAYFTARIDSFVTANGRKSIGWDEILEAGDLSPGAAVMSWRGTAGGIEGAKKGHKVVMTPYRYTYLDFYQSDPALEPDITYWHLYLDSVYAFEPLTGLDQQAGENVMGVQACLWTENIKSEERVEYMLLPRMIALAEVAWSPPAKKDYRRFIDKLENELSYLSDQEINYAKSMYNISIKPHFDSTSTKPVIRLHDQVAGKYSIRYTIDGTKPTGKSALYEGPVTMQRSTTIRSALFHNQKMLGKVNGQHFPLHSAIGLKAEVLPETSDKDALAAYQKLTDGILGTIEPYDGRWMFFRDSIVTITINLQQTTPLKKISFRMLEDKVGNAFLPGKINVAVSQDGKEFKDVFGIANRKLPQQDLRHIVTYEKPLRTKAKSVRIQFTRGSAINGQPAEKLMFVDEIAIQ
jgi:hexosaminidase